MPKTKGRTTTPMDPAAATPASPTPRGRALPFRDRVVGLVRATPDRLLDHPENWRVHPEAQASFLRDVLGDIGIAGVALAVIADEDARRACVRLKKPGARQAWLDAYEGPLMLTDGHLRKKTITQPIPTVVLDLSPEEARRALATHDTTGAMAETDVARLRTLVEGSGFEGDVLARLRAVVGPSSKPKREGLAALADSSPLSPWPDAPSPSAEDVLAVRARWAIVEGDALALLASLPDDSIDALITDPPYSSGGAYRGDRTQSTTTKYVQSGQKTVSAEFTGDNRDQRSFVAWCVVWLGEALRVLKPGAPVCLFSDWRQLPAVTDAFQAGGFVWRGIVPWDKTEATRPVLGRFRAQAEYVVWGSKGPMSQERPVPVLPGAYTVPVNPAEKFHQTGKPVALMQRICAICEPGGVIVDPFFGSGSTGAAALIDGYRVIGSEFSKESGYAALARGRLAHLIREGA